MQLSHFSAAWLWGRALSPPSTCVQSAEYMEALTQCLASEGTLPRAQCSQLGTWLSASKAVTRVSGYSREGRLSWHEACGSRNQTGRLELEALQAGAQAQTRLSLGCVGLGGVVCRCVDVERPVDGAC